MSDQRDPCIICQLADQPTGLGAHAQCYRTSCARCGTYDWEITTPAAGRHARQVKMSGFVRDQNKAGIYPLFTSELVQRVERMTLPRLKERADRLLAALIQQFTNTDWFNPVDDGALQAISYSSNADQMYLLLEILASDGVLQYGNGIWRITPRGFLRAEEGFGPSSSSHQAFVAMSFDASLNDSFTDGFDPAIRQTGYVALRIDHKEHINGISDEIIAEIRRSRFLIADYTLMNSGVYFEAGFAIGLGIPVIPTCRSDYIRKLHFDIRHINTLTWDSPDDLRISLVKRISAVIGNGPYDILKN
jgi:hypothetical protein